MNESRTRVRPPRLRGVLAWLTAVILVQAMAIQPVRAVDEPVSPPAVEQPATDPAAPPATDPAAPPATDPAAPPATDPGAPPATDPAAPPATDPATPPATDPATPPATDPATPPATDPGAPPATDPATDPGAPPATDPATPPVEEPILTAQPGPSTELIVRWRSSAATVGVQALGIASARAVAAARTGAQLLTVSNADLPAVMEKLHRDPQVEYVEPNYQLRALDLTTDARVSEQWALPEIQAGSAWVRAEGMLGGAQPTPVAVAVVDSGVDMSHEDLAGRFGFGLAYNAITGADSANVTDDVAGGHGTHVAGIIAAATNNNLGIAGVAGTYPVQIMPVKVLDAAGVGTMFDVSQGIIWAVDNGARVINLSLGARLPDYPRTLADAIKYAQDNGVLVIAAAGNDGASSLAGYYPASLPGVISVAATGADHHGTTYTNRGALVAAPGDNILSTSTGAEKYTALSGTSFAAPMAAGTAALVWTVAPGKTAAEVGYALKAGMQDYPEGCSWDWWSGYHCSNHYLVLSADGALSVIAQNGEPSNQVEITAPAGGAHVSGTVTITAQVANPAIVEKVEFYAGAETDTNVQPFKTLIGQAGGGTPDAPGAQFAATWDTTQVPNGPYLISVWSYANGEPYQTSAAVIVANNPVSGLAVTVKKPDGTPAAGAQVLIFHPNVYDENGHTYYYLEQVGQGQTFAAGMDGKVILPNTVAQDGNDFLVLAYGTEPSFLYFGKVRTPAVLTLDATHAAHLTLSAADIAGVPLGAAEAVAELLLTTFEPDYGKQEVFSLPVTLPATGTSSLYVSPGRYNFRLSSADNSYYLAQWDVNVTGDAAVDFRPTAATVAAIHAEADPGLTAEYSMTVFENGVSQQVIGTVLGPVKLRVTPGDYTPTIDALIPDPGYRPSGDAQMAFALFAAPGHFTAGSDVTVPFGGNIQATAALSSSDSAGIKPDSYLSFDATFSDAHGNRVLKVLPFDGAGKQIGTSDIRPSLMIRDSSGAPVQVLPNDINAWTTEPIGHWSITWHVPANLAPGTYSAQAYLYVGPLSGDSQDPNVYAQPVDFQVGTAAPQSQAQLKVTVLDRLGDPMPYVQLAVLTKGGQSYYPNYWGYTDEQGVSEMNPWWNSGPQGLDMLAVQGQSPDPDDPSVSEEVFVLVPIPAGSVPLAMTVDLSSPEFHLQRVLLQTKDSADQQAYAYEYGIFGFDAGGAMAGLSAGGAFQPTAMAGQGQHPVWVQPGRHVFMTMAWTQAGDRIYALSPDVNVPDDLAPDGTVTLGGSAMLSRLDLTLPPASNDYYTGALVLFDPTRPAIGSPNLRSYGEGALYITAGTYLADVVLVRTHYDGDWDYWMEKELTVTGGTPTVLKVDGVFQAQLSLNGNEFRPGDHVVTTHTLTDGQGNRLVQVAQNLWFGMDGRNLVQAWRMPGGGVVLNLKNGTSADFKAQNHQEIAPFLTILGPTGTEVYRHKDAGRNEWDLWEWTHNTASGLFPLLAGGTYVGDELIVPETAANGTYTVTLELSVGPEPMISATPVTFTVSGAAAAPQLNAHSPTNQTTVTVTGTAAPGATITVTYQRSGGQPVTVAPVTATANGAFSVTVTLPSAGTYTFTATDTTGGQSGATSAPMTLIVDLTPPGAPVQLQGTAPDDSHVRLTWTAPADTDITEYRIMRNGTRIGTVQAGATLEYLDSGLDPETDYAYQVLAVDQAGNTAGAGVTVKTLAVPDTEKPTVPESVEAEVDAENGVITVTWDAATDNVAVTGYRVYRQQGTDAPAMISEVAATVREYVDQHPPLETMVVYSVTAVDAAGNESDPGLAPSFITPGLPAPALEWEGNLTRNARLRQGSTLTFTLEGTPGYTGAVTVAYTSWYDAGGNELGVPAATTATVTLTEQAADPGVYTGTFQLPAGMATLTNLTGTLSDTATPPHTSPGASPTTGLPRDVAGALLVTLTPPGDTTLQTLLSALGDGRVIAYSESTHSGATAEIGSSAAGTYTLTGLVAATDYSVRVTDRRGQNLIAASGKAVRPGMTDTVTLTPAVPATIRIFIQGPEDRPASGVPVEVKNPTTGAVIAQPVTDKNGWTYTLTGFQVGDQVSITPRPRRQDVIAIGQIATLRAGLNEISLELRWLERGQIIGTVTDGTAPLPGVAVTAKQNINGQNVTFVSQPTGYDGKYSVPAYLGYDAELTAGSSWGRYTQAGAPPVVQIAAGTETITQDIVMETLGAVRVTVDLYTKYLNHTDETKEPILDWRNAVHFGLSVTGPHGSAWGWQYPVEIQAKPGDQLTVCVSGREMQLPDGCATAVVQANRTAHAEIHLVQQAGSVMANFYDASSQPLTAWTATLLMKQAADGRYAVVRQLTGSLRTDLVNGHDLVLPLPGAGEYQLYVETATGSLLQSFESTGAEKDLGNLHLSAAGVFRGQAGSGVSVAPAEVTPGGVVTFRAAYQNGSATARAGAQLHLTIPAGTTLIQTNVILNGVVVAPENLSATGFDVTLGNVDANQSGALTWQVTLDQAFAAPAVTAWANISWNDNAQGEQLGAATARVIGLDIVVPDRVPTPTARLSGRGPLNSTVTVTSGNVQLGTATVSPAGLWSMTVQLPVTTGVAAWVELRAEATAAAGGAVLATATRRVKYDPTEPYLSSATMYGDYYGEPTRSITIDPTQGVARFPYVYIPGQQMNFNLDFANPNLANRIYDVKVGIGNNYQAVATPGANLLTGEQHFTAGMGSGWQMGPVWVSYKVRPASYQAVSPPAVGALKALLGDAWRTATFGSFQNNQLTINLNGDAAQQVTVTYTVGDPMSYTPSAADAAKADAGGAKVYELHVTTNADGSIDLSAVVPAATPNQFVRVTIHIATTLTQSALLQTLQTSADYSEGTDELDKLIERAGACQLRTDYELRIDDISGRLQTWVLLKHVLQLAGAYLADANGGNAQAIGAMTTWVNSQALSYPLERQWESDLEALTEALLADQRCVVEYWDDMIIMVPVWIMDPSGYVYEAVPENRLSGVTATLLQDNGGGTWAVWDAAWYGQDNPLTTDAQGKYGWDVPNGTWMVEYQKDGYEPVQSPAIVIPPPRTDVNQAMTSLAPPTVMSVALSKDGTAVDVTFSKYMLVSSLAADSVQLRTGPGAGVLVAGTVTPVSPVAGAGAVQLFKTARFAPTVAFTNGTTYAVSISSMLQSYAGVPVGGQDYTANVVARTDMLPPAEVTGAAATPGDGQLTLTWTNPADADFAQVKITYWDGTANQVLTQNKPQTSAAITGLTNGLTYTFKLTTIDTAGNESAGVTITGKPADTTPPPQVRSAQVIVNGAELAVVWTDPLAADFTKVQVAWTAAGGATGTAEVAKGMQTTTLTGVATNISSVTVTLKSVDAAGNASAAVTLVYPTPSGPPVIPVFSPVSGVQVTAGDGQLTVTWTDPSDTRLAKVQVTWDGGSADVAKGAQSYTITGLTNGKQYTVSLTAVDTTGSLKSAAVSATGTPKDQVAPGAVTGLTGTAGDGKATITWTDPGDKDIAQIMINWDGGSDSVRKGVQTYTITGLTNGKSYVVTVVVTDTSGNKSAAATVTAKPVAPAPTTPPDVVVQVPVGTEGGQATSADGTVRLVIPAGAFPAGTTVTVRKLEKPAGQGLVTYGLAYELDAGGVQPSASVQLTLPFDKDALGTFDVRKLGVYRQDDNDPNHWVYVGGAVDEAAGTVHTALSGFSRYAVMAYDQSFADLSSHWSRSDVEVLVSRHVVNGTSADAFEPDRLITRAEMAKLLVAMLNAKLITPDAPAFADVAPGAWYYSYVETAAKLGLVKGDSGKFRPDDTITREELATMLVRALGLEDESNKANAPLPFGDANAISGWAKGYMTLAWQKGFVRGMTADSIGSKLTATRAQAAVMVLRAMTWQGQIIAPVTVNGQLSVSDLEGRHYELQAGDVTYVLTPFGPEATSLLDAATGKAVEVTGLPVSGMSIFMRGPTLQVRSIK